MQYYFNKTLKCNFDEAIDKVTETLKKEGFGIITDIDVQHIFKKKLDIDFKKYKILGACNPSFAYKALLAEDKIGTMLPCNVIVQELDDNVVEVSAIDPIVSMQAINNSALAEIADTVQNKLKRAIESL
jgi:uncharacterized protein (DUF302 family)